MADIKLKVEGLTKQFGTDKALDGVSLEIENGAAQRRLYGLVPQDIAL